MDTIILIGGAPTAGKSTLARKLSKKLDMPWVSTDTIREMMRKIVRRGDHPALFHVPGENKAEVFLNKYSPREIVDYENRESREVWKAVRALIETDFSWGSFIVEGIAILPALVSRLPKADFKIKPVFLVDKDKERIRKVVYKRGLWDDADKYPDKLKPKEVEWAYMFNLWLEKEARKYRYPIYEIKKTDYPLSDIIKLLK